MLLTGRIRPAKSSMTGAYSSLLALRYNLHPCHTVDHFVCVCVTLLHSVASVLLTKQFTSDKG